MSPRLIVGMETGTKQISKLSLSFTGIFEGLKSGWTDAESPGSKFLGFY